MFFDSQTRKRSNGLPVEDDSNVVATFDGERCVLEFKAACEAHSGEYACKVFSADGTAACSAIFAVLKDKDTPKPSASAPRLLPDSPKEVKVKRGRPVILHAKVKGERPLFFFLFPWSSSPWQ